MGAYFFLFVGAVGLLRLPDFYTRVHAAGKCDTLGMLLSLIGLMIYQGFNLVSLKILIIWAFILLANPTATHALSRAAWKVGLKPWMKEEG
ncbi:MAG TPA: cation:proton antiporter [Peptococcaceae bacterium]|nr:cation:proton antiporter [Peptococcaceae bacterium]